MGKHVIQTVNLYAIILVTLVSYAGLLLNTPSKLPKHVSCQRISAHGPNKFRFYTAVFSNTAFLQLYIYIRVHITQRRN